MSTRHRLVLVVATCGALSCADPRTEEDTTTAQTRRTPAPAARRAFGTPRTIALASRAFRPTRGVSQALLRTPARGVVHVIAQRQTMPDPAAWSRWAADGMRQVSYLGDLTWVLTIEVGDDPVAGLQAALTEFEASSFTEIRPEDRASPSLLGADFRPWAYRRGLVEVSIAFFAGTDHADAMAAIDRVGAAGAPTKTGPNTWSARISPARLGALLSAGPVERVEQIDNPDEPLMDIARRNIGADAAQGILQGWSPPRYSGLTGLGVTLSNSEGLNPNHDDFWNHDSAGNRTTQRWQGCGSGGAHGWMTAGIMLGNGWRSQAAGGRRFAYRGIAPEATFGCSSSIAKPDARNYSFTQGNGPYGTAAASTDRIIRGDDPTHRPIQVGAVANQGIHAQYGTEIGYYSVYRNSKNEIVVANFSDRDFQWNRSSIGPTWDGRIKPDLAAPGSAARFQREHVGGLTMDVDRIEVVGQGAPIVWSFDGSGPGWNGGWGDEGWWGYLNIDPMVQIHEGSTHAMRLPVRAPPYGSAWANRPKVGTLTGPGGVAPFSIDGAAGDRIRIRYRLSNAPSWTGRSVDLAWSTDVTSYDVRGWSFSVIADGKWHTANVDVGNSPRWVGETGINYLNITFGGPRMHVPGADNRYGGASGSSAAAPVVTGAVALLLQQVVDLFGVQLGDRSPSPYWLNGHGAGVPLGSTFKALLIHTARDLASTPGLGDPLNPDTGAVTVWHDGPDLVSGYGMVDIAAAVALVQSEDAARASQPGAPYHHIVEANLDSSAAANYQIAVPAGQQTPLKVTLAWDDAPGSTMTSPVTPKLVNDLDVLLVSPSGTLHFPWTIDPPYVPASPAEYPSAIEPEPILPESIRAARNDQRNDRDNVEQVVVEFPEAGVWQVLVLPAGLATPPQRYSLVLGAPAARAPNLGGGSVVFTSNRVSPQQLFVKPVDSAGPPAQLTSGPFAARHPAWAPSGRYVAYITKDVTTGRRAGLVDILAITDLRGTRVAQISAPQFGFSGLGYPEWSPDGRRLVVTVWNSWGARGLMTVTFSRPYRFADPTFATLVPPGTGAADLDATDAVFSPDGRKVYFHASTNYMSGGLFSVPATGGEPYELHGNGAPIRHAYQVSVSSDGRRLIYNSELYREDSATYDDEELLELDVLTGVSRRLTFEPGNQYGWFAVNGRAGELVMQSSPTVGGNNQLYLQEDGVRLELDIADPGNTFSDSDPKWFKPRKVTPPVAWPAQRALPSRL